MRALLQRVTRACVTVDGEVVGEIGSGLAILLGITADDDEATAAWLAARAANLRIFDDANGAMNLSLLETGGAALVIPQFTLYGDARRGRRPSFTEAAPPEIAAPLCESYCQQMEGLGVQVARGRFRAHMVVEIHNDGPVTLMLDSAVSRRGNPRS